MDQKVDYVMLQGLPSRSLLDEMAAAKDVETALIAALKVTSLCSLLLTPSPAALPLAHLCLTYAPCCLSAGTRCKWRYCCRSSSCFVRSCKNMTVAWLFAEAVRMCRDWCCWHRVSLISILVNCCAVLSWLALNWHQDTAFACSSLLPISRYHHQQPQGLCSQQRTSVSIPTLCAIAFVLVLSSCVLIMPGCVIVGTFLQCYTHTRTAICDWAQHSM